VGDTGIIVAGLVLVYLAIFLFFGVVLRSQSALALSRRRPDAPAQKSVLSRMTDHAVGALDRGI
jgi:tight adherence protein B